jgi:hypothetical protein
MRMLSQIGHGLFDSSRSTGSNQCQSDHFGVVLGPKTPDIHGTAIAVRSLRLKGTGLDRPIS